MGAFDDVDKVPRRTMVLFFIADTSTSMKGDKMKSLNTAVKGVLPFLSDLSAENADAEIKVAVLDFASGTEWMYASPVEASEFKWRELSANGLTDLGEACVELNEKLSTKAFMNSASGSFAPVIILFSDGEPTDNYKKGISLLNGNNWFRSSIRIAIAIGEDANKKVLAEFTGNQECVLTVHNADQLKKIIHFVSVTASQVASKNASVGAGAPKTKSEEVIVKLEQAKNSKELEGIDIGTDAPPSSTDAWGSW